MNDQILWQQYIERIESLSPESSVSRFCKEAGFMRVVEVGQYLMTKDTGNRRQFRSVACREYTLPRDDPASQPKGWIQGNMRIGLVLEVTTIFKHFKYGLEIRIKSVNCKGRTSCGCQDPEKSVPSDDRTGKPEKPSRPGYSQEDYGRSWSSQEWKSGDGEHDRPGQPDKNSWDSLGKVVPHHEEPLLDGNAHSVRYGETIHDRTVKPVSVHHQIQAYSETFVMGSDAAEFANKVKDQVRNRQKIMSNVAESGEEHSIIWGMFMATTLNAATFMGKNFSTIQCFVKNFEDLTLKQMFDVTAQLVNNQDEVHGLDKILWRKNSWKRLSLIGDETVINLQSTKVYVFSDSVLCLGRILQHPESNEGWKNRIAGIQSGRSYRDYDGINGESTEFEWNIFPGFTTLQLCGKVNDLLSDLGEAPENFTGRILFMSMFNDISCEKKDNEEECLANAKVVSVYAKKFGIGQWSFIGLGSEKSGILWERTVHKESGIISRKRC